MPRPLTPAGPDLALRLARDSGERRPEGGSAGNLRQFNAHQGYFAQDRHCCAQALQIAPELGARRFEATTRGNLGLRHHGPGRPAQAAYGAALDLAGESWAASRSQGQFLTCLGSLRMPPQRLHTALACRPQGQALLGGISDGVSLGILRCALAEAEHGALHAAAAGPALAQAPSLANDQATVGPNQEWVSGHSRPAQHGSARSGRAWQGLGV